MGDLFFGGVRQITHDRAIALKPRWSPDGQKIDLHQLLPFGIPGYFPDGPLQLPTLTFASFRGTNSGARFSPDGSRVAMVLSGEGSSEIYVSNPEGRNVARRTHYESVKASPVLVARRQPHRLCRGQPGPAALHDAGSGGVPQRVT